MMDVSRCEEKKSFGVWYSAEEMRLLSSMYRIWQRRCNCLFFVLCLESNGISHEGRLSPQNTKNG